MILAPAAAPCRFCPYRRDVPSGIWDRSEYAKLAAYDRDTPFQPTGVFHCHEQTGCACAGWAATHDMYEMMSLRLAALAERISDADLAAILDYTTKVPVFASGVEAAAHGLRDIDRPGPEALRAMQILGRKLG